jgi:hypothetical protein
MRLEESCGEHRTRATELGKIVAVEDPHHLAPAAVDLVIAIKTARGI